VLLGDCGTEPDELMRCSPPLTITVTHSPLTFAWEPADCGVYTIAVMQGNPGNNSGVAFGYGPTTTLSVLSSTGSTQGPVPRQREPRTS
jgi:hypothetical protein